MALAALCYLVLAALVFHNLLPVLRTDLFGDLGDPLLNAAILEWNAKHLPLTAEWWNFPSFAPLSGVTAFTEHLLAAYPLTTPIIWMTGNPILAYNVLELVSVTLNGAATYGLVRELTGSRTGAFVGGLAFAFAPFHGEHATHVQMLIAFGMPLALLGLHRYVRDGRRRDLVWFAIGWFGALLSNAYLLVFFPMLVGLWGVWFLRAAGARRSMAVAVVATVATLPVVPVLVGYALRQRAYGLSRTAGEIQAFSATLGSIGVISHRAVLWKGWLPTLNETSLFPGIAIAVLAAIAVVTTPRRAVLFYLAGAVVMFALALGPSRGPYALLMQLPGAHSIRVPARAWLVGTLCLAVCAGFGAAWLAGHRRTRWLAAVFSVAVVAEGWFAGPAVEVPEALPLFIPADAMVLDLPLAADFGNADAQYKAVLGDYRVVNGYSGYAPPHFAPLRAAVAQHREAAFVPFRQRADLYIAARPDTPADIVEWLDALTSAKHVIDFGNWRLYRLSRITATAPSSPLLPMPHAGQPAIAIPAD